MRTTAVRDRITKQFRDAAAAVLALAIQQDEANSGPMKGGFPMGGGTSGYAPRTPAGASRAAEAEPGLSPGLRPLGAVRSRAALRCRFCLPRARRGRGCSMAAAGLP
jgi:hypothetical protein